MIHYPQTEKIHKSVLFQEVFCASSLPYSVTSSLGEGTFWTVIQSSTILALTWQSYVIIWTKASFFVSSVFFCCGKLRVFTQKWMQASYIYIYAHTPLICLHNHSFYWRCHSNWVKIIGNINHDDGKLQFCIILYAYLFIILILKKLKDITENMHITNRIKSTSSTQSCNLEISP